MFNALISQVGIENDKPFLQAWSQELTDERFDLNFAKTSENRKLARIREVAAKIDADIDSATAEKASYQPIIASLPTGNKLREELEDKVTTLDYRLFVLNNRKEKQGKNAIYNSEKKIAVLQHHEQELLGLMQAVAMRISQLP